MLSSAKPRTAFICTKYWIPCDWSARSCTSANRGHDPSDVQVTRALRNVIFVRNYKLPNTSLVQTANSHSRRGRYSSTQYSCLRNMSSAELSRKQFFMIDGFISSSWLLILFVGGLQSTKFLTDPSSTTLARRLLHLFQREHAYGQSQGCE